MTKIDRYLEAVDALRDISHSPSALRAAFNIPSGTT
jgi:hypothetical protein